MKVEGAWHIPDLSDEALAGPVRAALEALAGQNKALRDELDIMQQQLRAALALADEDVLTNVLNRRAFVRELQRAIALAQRHEIRAAVVYFDLDGFKAVNDRFGHAAGDAALKATADRLCRHVREEDVVARLGGDEFAVLLAHADRAAAIGKAEALKAAVETEPVLFGGEPLILAITYGVRELGGADAAEHALAEADAAMYLRKPLRP